MQAAPRVSRQQLQAFSKVQDDTVCMARLCEFGTGIVGAYRCGKYAHVIARISALLGLCRAVPSLPMQGGCCKRFAVLHQLQERFACKMSPTADLILLESPNGRRLSRY